MHGVPPYRHIQAFNIVRFTIRDVRVFRNSKYRIPNIWEQIPDSDIHTFLLPIALALYSDHCEQDYSSPINDNYIYFGEGYLLERGCSQIGFFVWIYGKLIKL